MNTSIAPWGMKNPALAPIAEQCIAEISARRSASAGSLAWLRGDDGGGSGFAGGLTSGNAQMTSSWIYACIAAISEEIANLPFRFSMGQREGEDILEQGDFVTLFEQPHPYLNKFEFWEYIVGWLLLRGRCFLIGYDRAGNIVRWRNRLGENSKPVELFILNPDRIQKQCSGGRIYSWRYYSGQDEPVGNLDLAPDELLWMRLPLIGDFYEGLAPLTVALTTAKGDYAGAQFMKGLMENNADQGLIVSTEQNLSKEQLAQIDAGVRNRKRMAGRADKPLILYGGLKVEKPTISMVDLQFLEQRKFNRQEICAVMRVPELIIGYTDDANRSVSQSIRLIFIEGRILPFAERLESFVTPIVQAFDPKLYGWFDKEQHPVMVAARRERWDGATKAFAIGIPIDECSKQFDLGLPDDLPHRGKSFLPFSMQEFGTEPAQPPPEPGSPAATATPGQEAGKAISKALDNLKSQISDHVCGPSASAYEAAIAGSIKLKKGKLSKFFFEQRNRVLARLDSAIGDRLLAIPKGLEDLLNLIEENKVLWQRMGKAIQADFEFGVAQLGEEIGIDNFKVSPVNTIAFLSKRENMIQEVNRTTFDSLTQSLSDGMAAGETHDDLVDRVKAIFQDATDARAESIATTETNIAVNSGRHDAMKEAGVERKGWRTSRLPGVRATHIENEDYSEEKGGIGLDERWPNGLLYPGDPAGPPGEVINCRCFGYAVLPEKAGIANSRSQIAKVLSFEEFMGRAG